MGSQLLIFEHVQDYFDILFTVIKTVHPCICGYYDRMHGPNPCEMGDKILRTKNIPAMAPKIKRFENNPKVDIANTIFELWDSNRDDALTWPEVESCEEKYCGFVNFECPPQEIFDLWDIDADGKLTRDEYFRHLA